MADFPTIIEPFRIRGDRGRGRPARVDPGPSDHLAGPVAPAIHGPIRTRRSGVAHPHPDAEVAMRRARALHVRIPALFLLAFLAADCGEESEQEERRDP